ncbi:MAG TPA: hypothetical protein VIW73_03820 [Candidatus Cybelea sp.]
MPRMVGKLPPKRDDRTLLFEEYLSPRLAEPPARVDRESRVHRWPMYANDRLCDCTCAAAAHMVQSWTAYARRREIVPEWRAVVASYYAITGGRDEGAYCLDVLKHWRAAGVGGDRIAAFAQLRDRDSTQLKLAIDLFGSCYLGFALPDFALHTRRRWDVPASGSTGNARPNERNGHCVSVMGYDAAHLYIVTWGRLKAVTWAFFSAYMDEAYAVLSRDWLSAARKAPSGFGLRALRRDLERLGGR